MKSADDIKKGLEHCINGTSCRGCPYCEECATASDCNPMHKDLQDYIRQLEADKQQLEGMLTHMNQLRDAAAGRALKMEERVQQLEAERDAAVKTINEMAELIADDYDHSVCKWCEWCDKKTCKLCIGYADFKWRGVQKEE